MLDEITKLKESNLQKEFEIIVLRDANAKLLNRIEDLKQQLEQLCQK